MNIEIRFKNVFINSFLILLLTHFFFLNKTFAAGGEGYSHVNETEAQQACSNSNVCEDMYGKYKLTHHADGTSTFTYTSGKLNGQIRTFDKDRMLIKGRLAKGSEFTTTHHADGTSTFTYTS